MIALGAGVTRWFTWEASGDYQSLHQNTVGGAELGKADSALWQLRYAISQATSADEAGTRKWFEAEGKSYKAITDALAA
ncbi:MAG: hypothetical protein ACREX0_17325 [Noviherbaspirillum sp.]